MSGWALDGLLSPMQPENSIFPRGDEVELVDELTNSYSKIFVLEFDWKMIHQNVTNP